MNLFIITGFSLLILIGCKQENIKSHTDTLVLVNIDFNRYEKLFDNELTVLYNQIETIDTKDSVRKELIMKAMEIQKHSNAFRQNIDNFIEEKTNKFSLTLPIFVNYYKKDWNELNRKNFYLNNSCDQKSAFNIKEDLTSFRMHLIYINQKNIHSEQLSQFLATSIMTFNYLIDEPWEATLIINKTTLDLITTLNKLKFEARMSEFMTIKYLKMRIDEGFTNANRP